MAAPVQTGFDALEDQYLVFEADFTEGSSGIYRADLDGAATGHDSVLHDHFVSADSHWATWSSGARR
jgi:hypothetical protein